MRAALGDDPSAGPRQVAELVAAALGVPRRRAYEAALRVRGDLRGGKRRGHVGPRLKAPVRYPRCRRTT